MNKLDHSVNFLKIIPKCIICWSTMLSAADIMVSKNIVHVLIQSSTEEDSNQTLQINVKL